MKHAVAFGKQTSLGMLPETMTTHATLRMNWERRARTSPGVDIARQYRNCS